MKDTPITTLVELITAAQDPDVDLMQKGVVSLYNGADDKMLASTGLPGVVGPIAQGHYTSRPVKKKTFRPPTAEEVLTWMQEGYAVTCDKLPGNAWRSLNGCNHRQVLIGSSWVEYGHFAKEYMRTKDLENWLPCGVEE